MTRIFIAALVFILVCASQGFIPKPNNYDKDMARVTKYQGLYVFMQCQPLGEYQELGTVKKTGIVWNGDPTEMYETLVKKAKKNYDDAQGIIFDDVKMEHATVIKFK